MPHVLLLLSYTILCVHLQIAPIDHTELRQQWYQQWNLRTHELKEAEFCFVTISCEIISWDLALSLFDREGYRRKKSPPSHSDPRQATAGLAKEEVESRKYSWSKHISWSHGERKINTQTHKRYRSGLRSEILFAKLQLGVICLTEDFQKPQTDEILQWKCWCDSIWSAHPSRFAWCSFTIRTRLRNLKRFEGLLQLRFTPRGWAELGLSERAN